MADKKDDTPFDNPFLGLDKKVFPKNRGQQPAPTPKAAADAKSHAGGAKGVAQPAKGQQPPSPVTEPEAEPEEELFLQAMHGVDPLQGVKERVATKARPAQGPQPPDEEQEVAGHLADLVSGRVEFALEYSEDYARGHVKGLDTKTVLRLKAGHYSPEAHLDLHGLNAEQAFAALVPFMRESYMQGRRCVLLIPGRGKNSPDGQAVLRERVQSWLTRDPLKRVVLAFCTALPKHGGAGALYVLLRKVKGQGKINWERLPGLDPLLP